MNQFTNKKKDWFKPKNPIPHATKKINVTARKRIKAFGLTFDSKMEYEFFCWLKSEGFEFDYQKREDLAPYIKIDKKNFMLQNGGINMIWMKVDFVVYTKGPARKGNIDRKFVDYTFYIDTKGFHKERSQSTGKVKKNKDYSFYMLKYNLLKRKLITEKAKNTGVYIVPQARMTKFRQDLLNFRSGHINDIIVEDVIKP